MKKKNLFKAIICILGCSVYLSGQSQPVPAKDENIPYLVTFGRDAYKSWGDDDFCQIFFFKIPFTQKEPFYVRVYDPGTGGAIDELKGEFNTIVRFSIYGGKVGWNDKNAQTAGSNGKFESGNLLDAKSFGNEATWDQKWYTFGPFNPMEGELSEELNGHIFKIIAKGISGDDGNLYKYFLSTDSKDNKPVEGGNLFTYKYHFRLSDNQNDVSQIYPYIDDKVVSVKIINYDWDNDGFIRVVSVAKRGELCKISGDEDWATTELPILKEERNTSLEIQFIKNKSILVRNNNVVVIVQNQYGASLPFYVIPIGGIPVYKPALKMKAVEKK